MKDLISGKKTSYFSRARAAYFIAGALLVGGLVVATHSAAANPPDDDDLDLDQAAPVLGTPIYGGSGCPIGTARAVAAGNTVSILFDEYIAETRRGRQMARSSCNFAVPVRIPPNTRYSIVQADYRGYARIPRGGSGRFDAEYFFAGEWGPTLTRRLPDGWDDPFLFRDEVRRRIWSRCGGETIVRSNTSIVAEKRFSDSEPEAYMAVDSADVEIKFILTWERC